MTNRFIAGIAALAMALTAFGSTPAAALDRKDLGRIMLGTAAVIIIGRALDGNRRHTAPVTRNKTIHAPVQRFHKVVPGSCLRRNKFNNGPRQYLSRHCLAQRMRHIGHLPGHCRTNVWTNRGNRTVYSARCLQRNGWVLG